MKASRTNINQTKRVFYESIADDFDCVQNMYDTERRLHTVFDVFLRNVELTNRHFLDAGCGTGWFAAKAANRGAAVTAMDVGVNLLSQVRKKCKTATEVVGDMLDLPLENESFDIVLSTESIEHTADPQKAVSELCRVLKPGGSIIITCPNRLWSWTLKIAQSFKLRPYEGYENWVWWWDIKKWLSQNKIEILEMRGIHLFPPLQALNFLNPLLRVSEKLGRMGGPLYDTLAVKGQKIGSNAEPLN